MVLLHQLDRYMPRNAATQVERTGKQVENNGVKDSISGCRLVTGFSVGGGDCRNNSRGHRQRIAMAADGLSPTRKRIHGGSRHTRILTEVVLVGIEVSDHAETGTFRAAMKRSTTRGSSVKLTSSASFLVRGTSGYRRVAATFVGSVTGNAAGTVTESDKGKAGRSE